MRFYLLVLLGVLSFSAQAHQLSTAYLSGDLGATGKVQLELQTRLYDLERAVGMDTNRDGELLWGEVLDNAATLETYLQDRINLRRGDRPCNLSFAGPWKVDEHYGEAYLVTSLQAQCPLSGDLTLVYQAFFEQQPEHKLLVNFRSEAPGSSDTDSSYRVMDRSQQEMILGGREGNLMLTIKDFVKEGIVHIWIGLDHILFLVSLLLTSVLMRASGQWQPEVSVRRVVTNAVWIVTAFTLAHSVTLTATALGWVQPSSRWVEVAIALSVALAALNNVFPVVTRLSGITFAFGLIHGFGFAGVLGELGVPADQVLPTVLAFNLGVEIGQLAIVLVLLPCLMLLRHYRWFRGILVPAASVLIAGLAIYWVMTRM
ncbi:HupE/UreJ protein [Marinimicrobium koreense]|uniref:HupE/UreJ protein n=1 Tax=Marinimicrobium koreense TaxID=306545 RepID=A0A3N1NX78_9GAMM|nr:HupE/UreJ family protein [Marinimicrobium koreense]ROQ19898.1 HupE/UreJ protein [Marinimicrobium koreense]